MIKARLKTNIHTNEPSSGFVLPYVLLVIAILSITVIIAAERLQNVTQNIAEIENQFEVDLAFLNAEAEATYAVLTGKPMDFALDINPLTPHKTLIDLLADENSTQEEELIPPDRWSVVGGKRIANLSGYPVVVTLQDVSGLISLNIETDLVGELLKANGIETNTAQRMSARLNDYLDLDNKRRFLGAERADYRLRRLSAPTNSPLRNFDELSNVLGWKESLENVDIYKFMDMTSLHQGRSLSKAFMPEQLSSIFKANRSALSDESDGVNEIYWSSKEPSGTYRLTLFAETGAGRYRKRVLELTKQSSNFISPHKSFLVYERTLNSNDVDFDRSSLKNVFNTIPNTE